MPKSKNWVQTWCNTVNSWAKFCWTSQIASQWTVWDHKTISSEKLYSTSVPNTKYCQQILTLFHFKEPRRWGKHPHTVWTPSAYFQHLKSQLCSHSLLHSLIEPLWHFEEILTKKVMIYPMVLCYLKKHPFEVSQCFNCTCFFPSKRANDHLRTVVLLWVL